MTYRLLSDVDESCADLEKKTNPSFTFTVLINHSDSVCFEYLSNIRFVTLTVIYTIDSLKYEGNSYFTASRLFELKQNFGNLEVFKLTNLKL